MSNGTLLKPIEDIPPDNVGKVVQDSVDYDNVKKMDVFQQPDGKYTVKPIS